MASIPASSTALALPGRELVEQGFTDIHAGRVSVEALLLSRFAGRLAEVGMSLPGEPFSDPERRMYELLEHRVGPGAAHGTYNAMTRRLVSYLRAAEHLRAAH